jgi:nucleoside-diphosphate-sugar epimerase
MLIALTGATGFVGRAVAARLAEEGHRVRALVRDLSKAPASVETIAGSLGDEAALARLAEGSDAVIHLAGLISAPDTRAFHEANEHGARRMAEAAAAAGVPRFVHISSLSARAPGLSRYGSSKKAGETAVAAAAQGMSHLIIRPPAVYGPGDRATLPLIKALTGNPVVLPGRATSRFSLIHVGDLARIIAEAAASDRSGMVEVDDGQEGGYSWPELARLAGETQGRSLKPYFLPMPLSLGFAGVIEALAGMRGKPGLVSRDKIRELYFEDWVARAPGWPLASPTDFRAGFASTLQWYREAGWLPAKVR